LKVFDATAQADGVTNAGILSEGIHNALITTVTGLCVAVPSLVAYNYLACSVQHGRVVEVMDMAKTMGIERLAIATSPKKTP
jgi:biopolymer transport protein ExbB